MVSKEIKCDIYPCILVRNKYITENSYFDCTAMISNDCIWKDEEKRDGKKDISAKEV